MIKITQPRSFFQKQIRSADKATLSLDRLGLGQSGVITHLEAEAGLKTHLLELGFVPGSSVSFLMSTPFGDPNVYALRGTSFALRKSEAKCVVVQI